MTPLYSFEWNKEREDMKKHLKMVEEKEDTKRYQRMLEESKSSEVRGYKVTSDDNGGNYKLAAEEDTWKQQRISWEEQTEDTRKGLRI
jgi:hypothetical protein